MAGELETTSLSGIGPARGRSRPLQDFAGATATLKRVCQARDARKRQVRVVRYLKSWDIGGSGKETDVS